MIIIDRMLEERAIAGNPIRVAMVGCGFMGRVIALQILTAAPGMELVAIYNRHPERAVNAYRDAGVEPVLVDSLAQLEDSIHTGRYAVVEDVLLLAQAESIDALIEVTGSIEFACQVMLAAINNHKDVILMNAELDGTLGPILKVYADKAGVIYTNSDGDQPGVQMNLFRYVSGLGLKPILAGNIKGLHDPYRNPTTQEGFARRWGQRPHMVTSFADGSKISFEQAVVANATGMCVAKRGMLGPIVPTGTPLREAVKAFPEAILSSDRGIVDYLVGAEPAPGVFILATQDNPIQRHYLELYKMGEGPLYCFYNPYHLIHFDVPNTVARAVLLRDAVVAPEGGVQVEVVAVAKIDLQAGQVIDGIGYYTVYGVCENADIAKSQQLLPLGLSEGCTLINDIPKDQVLTYKDVTMPEGRLSDRLRKEQDQYF
jgi:predicted homoserine dehydrogenase-like protein